VLWIHASNAARFEESIGDVADQLRLYGRRDPKVNVLQLLQNWLATTRGGTRRWIIVLDSVDDAYFLLEPPPTKEGAHVAKRRIDYFPATEECCMLITSRTKSEAGRLVREINMVEVPPMDPEEAEKLLYKGLGSVDDDTVVRHLAEALDFMPLALSQSMSYIQARAPRCTIKQYIEMIESGRRERTGLLRQDGCVPQRDRDASNSIILTWQISFTHIQSMRPTAADLLALMSFCDCQAIPECLLNVLDSNTISATQGQDIVGEGFDEDILTLRAFSFISNTKAQSNSWQMHRLVQDSMQWWLRDCGKYESSEAHYINRLNHVLPTGDYENWDICKLLLPHIGSAVSLNASERNLAVKQSEIMYKVAWFTYLQQNPALALKMAEGSTQLRRSWLGEKDDRTLLSTTLLALAKLLGGQWGEAEELFVKEMETSRTVLGAEHPSTLTSMANLASTFWNQGRWKEAEELFVKVIETSRTVLGAEHPSTLTSMANLASTYQNQGRWKEAEEL